MFEKSRLNRVGVGEILQMPLHTQVPAVMLVKGDRLDGAVGRVGSGHQFVAEHVDALVMGAPDSDPMIGDHIAQRRFCVQFDLVHELAVIGPISSVMS